VRKREGLEIGKSKTIIIITKVDLFCPKRQRINNERVSIDEFAVIAPK
jgi:hypothetical protein|tara:strand:+ start:1022 stop:1165 length:144 start_codon:yes stop_codon:yes gene_type:complete